MPDYSVVKSDYACNGIFKLSRDSLYYIINSTEQKCYFKIFSYCI